MGNRKRIKKNKHQGMYKKLIRGKKPMSLEQKAERKKLVEESKKRNEELNKKL